MIGEPVALSLKVTGRAPQCVRPERSPQVELAESVSVSVNVAAAASITYVVNV